MKRSDLLFLFFCTPAGWVPMFMVFLTILLLLSPARSQTLPPNQPVVITVGGRETVLAELTIAPSDQPRMVLASVTPFSGAFGTFYAYPGYNVIVRVSVGGQEFQYPALYQWIPGTLFPYGHVQNPASVIVTIPPIATSGKIILGALVPDQTTGAGVGGLNLQVNGLGVR